MGSDRRGSGQYYKRQRSLAVACPPLLVNEGGQGPLAGKGAIAVPIG